MTFHGRGIAAVAMVGLTELALAQLRPNQNSARGFGAPVILTADSKECAAAKDRLRDETDRWRAYVIASQGSHLTEQERDLLAEAVAQHHLAMDNAAKDVKRLCSQAGPPQGGYGKQPKNPGGKPPK